MAVSEYNKSVKCGTVLLHTCSLWCSVSAATFKVNESSCSETLKQTKTIDTDQTHSMAIW